MTTQRSTTAAPSTALAIREALPEWALEPLKQFIDNPNYELLIPTLPLNSRLGYGYDVSVSVVQIDPNPDNREVFKVGKRGDTELFAYSKPALEKMALAAGISIGRPERMDDGKDPSFCHISVMGVMKNESGQPIVRSAQKAFHMAAVEEAAIAEKRKWKPDMTEEQARAQVHGEMVGFKKHLIARTETGAILRLIRQFLAIKSGLTKEQVAKPKVLVRVDWRPDASDPEVKRFLLEQGARATVEMFGPRPQPAQNGALPAHVEPSAAVVVDEIDEETQAAIETQKSAPAPQPAARVDSTAKVAGFRAYLEAVDGAGADETQAAALLKKHGGDYSAATKALNEAANNGTLALLWGSL